MWVNKDTHFAIKTTLY